MLGRGRVAGATPNRTATKATFTMGRLRHQALWGTAAAGALLGAVLAGFSDVGTQRAASLLFSLTSPSPRPEQVAARQALDGDAAARQLAQTVRGLAQDRDHIMTRIAALEHNLEDMTGSVSRQIEAAKAAGAEAPLVPWPDYAPPNSTPEASVETVATPVVPPLAGLEPRPPTGALTPSTGTGQPPDRVSAPSPVPPAYGADIGTARSRKALQARWMALRAAYGQVLDGLRPVVTVRDNPRSNRIELRLVVGPLANAEEAAQLCSSLANLRQSCQPTMFRGRRLLVQ